MVAALSPILHHEVAVVIEFLKLLLIPLLILLVELLVLAPLFGRHRGPNFSSLSHGFGLFFDLVLGFEVVHLSGGEEDVSGGGSLGQNCVLTVFLSGVYVLISRLRAISQSEIAFLLELFYLFLESLKILFGFFFEWSFLLLSHGLPGLRALHEGFLVADASLLELGDLFGVEDDPGCESLLGLDNVLMYFRFFLSLVLSGLLSFLLDWLLLALGGLSRFLLLSSLGLLVLGCRFLSFRLFGLLIDGLILLGVFLLHGIKIEFLKN